jgi:hypothetical protein
VTDLARRYDAFEALRREGRRADAARALLDLCGLEGAADLDLDAPRPPSATMIRYDAPRAVDVVALTRGARDVAKFEDLALPAATKLSRALEARGLRTKTVGPYARRMDVALSTDGARADRYTVVASRGDRLDAVLDAERTRSAEGTRRAGLALGYPPCCVARFVEVERSPEAARDGVNEASLRAFLDAGPVRWALNPLSTHALVGFMPCRGDCPAALSFANTIWEALSSESPAAAETVRATLSRPILFVRLPLFWVLDGARPDPDGTLRYARAVAHDDPSLPALSQWRDALLGGAIHRADGVSLDDRALTLYQGADPLARWELTAPKVPRLVTFT